MTSNDPPGVLDGVLLRPQEYFFWLIGRQIGEPAADWYTFCGGDDPPGQDGHEGITRVRWTFSRVQPTHQMSGGSGRNLTGRPTSLSMNVLMATE